jgi:hypothetical protein
VPAKTAFVLGIGGSPISINAYDASIQYGGLPPEISAPVICTPVRIEPVQISVTVHLPTSISSGKGVTGVRVKVNVTVGDGVKVNSTTRSVAVGVRVIVGSEKIWGGKYRSTMYATKHIAITKIAVRISPRYPG